MRQQLHGSWAGVFRTEVFMHIPEERFAGLYSETDSRPNAPVNVLVGGDMLKDGFGWSDEELERHLQFDLQTRYALGLDDLSQNVPTLRTFQNHRRRVREHAERTGENLYEVVFAVVTDEQIEKLKLKVAWQRMDSTQLLSNIAMGSRLELVLHVLQRGVAALPEARQAIWRQEQAAYVVKQPRHIYYGLKNEEVPGYLQQTGELLLTLLSELEAEGEATEARALVERVLREQYQVEAGETIRLREPKEVGADSLQSPHDAEATYREKNGERYRGYVTNISETCDPENPVQLIISVQTASNQTDDGQLLAQSLVEQAERGHQVDKMTVDGGYTGSKSEEACDAHGTELHPSRLRGGKSQGKHWGWEQYSWQLTDDGIPEQVGCPQGQLTILEPGHQEGRWLARLDPDVCAACPFFQKECRVEPRKRSDPTLLVNTRAIQVAVLRQRITAANNGVRAGVEATVRSVKNPFAAGKLPVRGLLRSQMVVLGSALLVNVHRLTHYYLEQASQLAENMSGAFILSLFWSLIALLIAVFRRRDVVFEQRLVFQADAADYVVAQPVNG
ncbi:MAG: transposase [Ardenticatenaceae bacterium]|nr:transposase [Ardenticatenaceae bacterium]